MDSYANGYDYYSNYGSSVDAASAVGGIFAGMMVFLGIIILIALVIGIIGIIGQWKVLKKAGQPGWPAIIPIYNTYMMCKISGVNPWWILIVFVGGIVGGIIPIIGSLLSLAISVYFSVILYVSIAKSFGKEAGWAVGLYFLQPFFMLALGVGKSQYLGPKPMNDPIMAKFNGNNQQNTVNPTMNNGMNQNMNVNNVNAGQGFNTPVNETPTENLEAMGDQATSFCPNCGTQIKSDSKFCPGCGRQF